MAFHPVVRSARPRAVAGGCALVLGSWAAARVARGYWIEWASLRPDHHTVVRPSDLVGARLNDVTFRARDGRAVRGWYVSSRTGAAVVLCHGAGDDRTGVLVEARALAAAGFGVLLYDAPGRGETRGWTTYGAPERAALRGALDFLHVRTDVDPGRIGAYGFSMGGYTVAQVAATDARVRAVVLAGTPDDRSDAGRAAAARERPRASAGEVLSNFGMKLARRSAALDFERLQPRDVVGAIAPRPILVVTGGMDPIVPPSAAQRLYDAAGRPKRLLRIERAGHGHYVEADSSYDRQLVAYFTSALRESGPDVTRIPARGRP